MCWVSGQLPDSNSTVKRGRDLTLFPEEQVLQLKHAGLGCGGAAARGQTEGKTWPRRTGAI